MKIATIIGARPQFIKAATISRAIIRYNAQNSLKLSEIILHTGQHYDPGMSQIFFDEMELPKPDYHLNIHGLPHGAMTGRMLEAIEAILLDHPPDVVLVYGDTNTTLAGALAAAKLKIPVAHVEAGLRSHRFDMPEEINRVLTDRISTLLFCPTSQAVENLAAEGLKDSSSTIVKQTGDVMFDAVLFYKEKAVRKATIFDPGHGLDSITDFALATVHRAQNTDDPSRLHEILEGFSALAEHIDVVLPLHPRTKKKIGGDLPQKTGLHIREPVGYFDMLALLDKCRLVITDSGGLQKEAFFLQKPCITLRDETEWTELVSTGANRLVQADREAIVSACLDRMQHTTCFSPSLYGDGNAAEKIVNFLVSL